MEKTTCRQYNLEEEVRIVRSHMLEGAVVSEICDREGIHPTLFYQRQRTFFENGAAALSLPDMHHKRISARTWLKRELGGGLRPPEALTEFKPSAPQRLDHWLGWHPRRELLGSGPRLWLSDCATQPDPNSLTPQDAGKHGKQLADGFESLQWWSSELKASWSTLGNAIVRNSAQLFLKLL